MELERAQRAVYSHPTSYAALLELGAAYLDNGRVAEADLTYQAATRIAPNRPEAPTLHAMLLGTIKRYRPALLLLQRIERAYPAYPQVWLIDGVLSRRVHGERHRAVRAWLRFMLLAPNSDRIPKVRRWITQLGARKH